METESALGGQKIEGVVIKPSAYNLFGVDKKVLMGKFVSETFKEKHTKEWKKQNPSSADVLEQISAEYRAEGRWRKAIQHLREAGSIDGSPRDIGLILKEIPVDIEKECSEEIKDRLWRWAWPHIKRKAVYGFPAWYKDQLMQNQFTKGEK